MFHYLSKGRRISIALTLSIVIAGFPIADRYSEAYAASSEETRVVNLTEGAKKEGKVAIYTAMAVESSKALVDKFQEKYPFIKAELYRASNISTLNRLLMEVKANKRTNDVVIVTGDITQALKENGVLAKYLSPESKFYPEGFKDKEGYWTDVFITVHSVVYNTRLVPPKEVPVKYKDLLHPKWKGKLGINLNNIMWIPAITRTMGEQEGMEFLKALAQHNPVVRNGGTLTVLLVSAGETALAVSVNANNVEDVKAKGAPVDWARLKEPIYGEVHPGALNAFAPHPNAAKLFIDFASSPEGQELILKFGAISSRKGMRPSPYIKAEDIIPLLPRSGKDTAYYNELIRKIFVK